MKKSLAAFAAFKLVFFALLAVGLLAASCGSDSSDSSSDTSTDATSSTVAASAEPEPSDVDDGSSDVGDGAPVATSSSPVASPSVATSTTVTTSSPETITTVTAEVVTDFPVTIADQTGEVTIDSRPERIVSLSATATEMLFAVGAGEQVVAVDSFSNYPPEAPTTDLSGFQPNIEAIAGYEPDLVLISFDPGGLVEGLKALGADVIVYSATTTLDDAYDQMEAIGAATGHSDEAEKVTADIERSIDEIVDSLDLPSEPFTYFLELDPNYYSVTSDTFIGQVFALAGLESIADAAGGTSSYPQLSEEYILDQNPDFIILTDCCDGSLEVVAARPGWSELDAVQGERVLVFSADVTSRWGPRMVEILETVSEAVADELAMVG